jgi:hypothetical protein
VEVVVRVAAEGIPTCPVTLVGVVAEVVEVGVEGGVGVEAPHLQQTREVQAGLGALGNCPTTIDHV